MTATNRQVETIAPEIPYALAKTHLDEALRDAAYELLPTSRRAYRTDALQFAHWLLEHDLTPNELTRSDMLAYRGFLQTRQLANASANRKFSVARTLLEQLVLNDQLHANPATGIEGFTTNDETTHVVLTDWQAQGLIDAIDTSTLMGQRDYVLILLLLRTGIRRAEAAALRVADLSEDQGHHIATIRHGKGNRRRTVKVPVDVWRDLDNYLQAVRLAHASWLAQLTAQANERIWVHAEQKAAWLAARTREHEMSLDDPLFVSFRRGDHPTRKPIGEKSIENQVRFYAELIGLDKLRPHGLRATFITLTLENGATLEQTQYAAGHRDPRTTQRYRARKLNLDNNAVDKLTIRRHEQ